MLQDEINQKEKGCLQVAARSASRTFCSAKPAGGLRHMHPRKNRTTSSVFGPTVIAQDRKSSFMYVKYCRWFSGI